jgi:hypothetical protein
MGKALYKLAGSWFRRSKGHVTLRRVLEILQMACNNLYITVFGSQQQYRIFLIMLLLTHSSGCGSGAS